MRRNYHNIQNDVHSKSDTPEHSDTEETTLCTLSNAHPMRLRSNHTLETGSRVPPNPGGGSACSVNEIEADSQSDAEEATSLFDITSRREGQICIPGAERNLVPTNQLQNEMRMQQQRVNAIVSDIEETRAHLDTDLENVRNLLRSRRDDTSSLDR